MDGLSIGHLSTIDLAVVLAYGVGMLLIGYWSARKQKSTEEYFVAGRGMSPTLVGISMLATLLSTISYLTVPGEIIQNGPGMMWGIVSLPISYVLVAYLIIPRLMKFRITSAYELLEERFGPKLRKAASGLFVFARLTWMAFIIYTCSHAVSTITGIKLDIILAAVGVFATVYTVMGGIRAVIITDVIQFVFLFGGAIGAIIFITVKCGGFSWWPNFAELRTQLNWPDVPIVSADPFERVTVFRALLRGGLWWILIATSDQVMVQRFLCTSDIKEARRSFGLCLISNVLIVIVLWIVGMALLGFFTKFPMQLADTQISVSAQADNLFPHFIGAILPAGVSGLLVAALFAAAMSSMDSGINSISTVLITDFRSIFQKPGASNDNLLAKAKLVGLFTGLIALLLSYTIGYIPGENLFDVNYRVSDFIAVPVFLLFLLLFFVKFSTPAGAWSALITGFLAGVFFSYFQQIVELFGYLTQPFSVTLIMPLSTLIGLVMGVVISKLAKFEKQQKS